MLPTGCLLQRPTLVHQTRDHVETHTPACRGKQVESTFTILDPEVRGLCEPFASLGLAILSVATFVASDRSVRSDALAPSSDLSSQFPSANKLELVSRQRLMWWSTLGFGRCFFVTLRFDYPKAT